MRNLTLTAALALSLMGTFAVASDAVPVSYLGGKKGDTGSDTGSWDSGKAGETGDTDDTDDTYTGDSGDSGDSGGSSGYECDTADTGGCDTGDGVGGYSAAELAGETGGFGCATLGGRASGLLVFGSVMLLLWRRDD